eukprot:TRINITY_DN37927_c0_g1_i1.p1 TRINITY_DN37927_c0_g1~~TRINITY_DN37927_c0_g1_i1.p1  ORF type:complete len:108 (+),score=21.61 TRINITY_DN37927_c0_g1_i1:44-325(+)
MDITVRSSQTDYPPFNFAVTVNTLVNDILVAVSECWGAEPELLTLYFGLEELSPKRKMVSYGIQANAELTAVQVEKGVLDPDLMDQDPIDCLL